MRGFCDEVGFEAASDGFYGEDTPTGEYQVGQCESTDCDASEAERLMRFFFGSGRTDAVGGRLKEVLMSLSSRLPCPA